MKQLTCEMCGSTDLVKQDGVFVCQSCGTKYSIEEAKKMMVEGTVDVSGSTVKVDTSDELKNLYQIARRAKNENNAENAAKYYDMILVKDPTSWEAAFYTVYFRAMQCKIAEIESAAISVQNCMNSVLALIRDHVDGKNEKLAVIHEVGNHCQQIAYMLATASSDHYHEIGETIRPDYFNEFMRNLTASTSVLTAFAEQLELVFHNDKELCMPAGTAYKACLKILELYPDQSSSDMLSFQKLLAVKIKRYDAGYAKPHLQEIISKEQEIISKEIEQIDRQIAALPTVRRRNPFLMALGAVWIIGCIIIFPIVTIPLDNLLSISIIAVGLIPILLGIKLSPPQSVVNANIEKINQLKEKREHLRGQGRRNHVEEDNF